MKIVIGADHTATVLKFRLTEHLRRRGFEVEDMGTFDDTPADYPEIAVKVCKEVTSGAADLGVLICGTGIGMSIAANKVKGIRCALCNDLYSGRKAREHNDANVIAFGARVIGPGVAIDTLDAFLEAEFAPRHQGRLDMISQME